MIRFSRLFATALAVIILAPFVGPIIAHAQGTGLPLPRFVSLRSDEINMRTGPGVQYPVEWVFQREGLPVEIIKEYRTWRLVRDWQGTQGWMHQSMLSGRRTFMVTGKDRTVRARSDANSAPVAVMQPNTLGELMSCPAASGWCQVKVKGIDGWLRRVEFWGAYRNETFE